MAIDTKEKRRAAIDFGKWCGTGMPVPMGHIPVQSRAHILNVYFETGIPPIIYFWRNRNRVVGSWVSKSAPATNWKSKANPSTTWSGKVTPQDGSTQEI